MRGKRTDTYYVYDAYTDELVGCGSLAKISELFEITPRTLKKYAENGSLYASRNTDNLLKFKRIDGIIEDIEPTIKLKPRPKPQIERKPNKLKCNFVEVFKVFKHQEAEEEKEHMRNNFSVINLERVRFELKKHAKESYPYRIAFYTKKSPTTLVFDEYFLSLELAEQRMEYLKNFKGKKDNGDFWYDGVNYEADRVIIATRTRNNRNMIISLDDISTKKTDYDEYLELARFIQSEFIR